ncbi:MAG: branched-chain amino acid transport system II carrier protein [Alphaproteobacteria bacterium]|nr:branched-chain amino acid transport system II carrier protein [Alphaproteobacteria bacterium]
MRRYKHIFIYGFAIFSMFFGSGNLVFPLEIGQNAGDQWFLGFLGLFLTGILLPFLGLFVIKLHHGSYNAFFAEAGGLARLILPLFTLSLLGSFGVVPRCITVAHGGLEFLWPQLSLIGFSFVFCIGAFLFGLREHFMLTILGKWMTPLLLISLLVLISLGIIYAPEIGLNELKEPAAFKNGFLRGYRTMDLFAAFFFSALIFKQIQTAMPQEMSHGKVIRAALKPSLVGSSLLALIYLGFVFLGAHYKSLTIDVSPQLILPTIAAHVLGDQATLLIGIIIVFSCLTTAVALNNIYAQYICSVLKLKAERFPIVLFATMGTSFLISLLDFQGIGNFLEPLLEVSYPSIILLTLLSIILKGHKLFKMAVFYGVLGVMVYYTYG